MRPAYSIFACVDHVPVSMFNWSMGSALASRVDKWGTRNADRDPICATIEVLWDNCFGRDQHVSNRNSNNGSDAFDIPKFWCSRNITLVDLTAAIAVPESQTFLNSNKCSLVISYLSLMLVILFYCSIKMWKNLNLLILSQPFYLTLC